MEYSWDDIIDMINEDDPAGEQYVLIKLIEDHEMQLREPRMGRVSSTKRVQYNRGKDWNTAPWMKLLEKLKLVAGDEAIAKR